MSRFKVGDRAVVVQSISHPETIGMVVAIKSELYPVIFPGSLEPGTLVHELDAPVRPAWGTFVAPPSWLAPLERDGSEATEWSPELSRLCGRKETVE